MPRKTGNRNQDNNPIISEEITENGPVIENDEINESDVFDLNNNEDVDPYTAEYINDNPVYSADDNDKENEMTSEINEPSPEEIIDGAPAENVTDNSEEKTEEKAEEVKNLNPWVPVEDIPDFNVDLGKAFALQIVTFRNSFIEMTNTLKASKLDESTDGIVSVAETLSSQGNDDVKDKLQTFIEVKALMENCLKELTDAVKADESLKIKTPEELASLKTEADDKRKKIDTSIAALIDFEKSNPGGSIQDVIDYINALPALPGIKSASTKSATSKESNVARPRLGKGGYIKVEGTADGKPFVKQYDNISGSLPDIKNLTGNSKYNATDVLNGWLAIANKNDWHEIPTNKELTFDLVQGVKVTIKRV